jgi:NitT/TauT family transport system substrate-binding protein
VVITRGDYIKNNPKIVHSMIDACREGWQAYLKDPKPANDVMHELNKTMDAETFAAAAEAQKPLVAMKEEPKDAPLGSMTVDRWDTLAKQLVELKVIEQAPAGKDCMLAQ